jgi:hypothetical protein
MDGAFGRSWLENRILRARRWHEPMSAELIVLCDPWRPRPRRRAYAARTNAYANRDDQTVKP